MVCCKAVANWDVVFCNASVMAVVLLFPCATALVINVSAADRSDDGADGATETFDGGTGGGGNGIGK